MPDTERNLVQEAGEKVALVYDDLRKAREKIIRLEAEADAMHLRVQDLEAEKRSVQLEIEILKQEREAFVTHVGSAKMELDVALGGVQKAIVRKTKPLQPLKPKAGELVDKGLAELVSRIGGKPDMARA